MIHRIDLIPTDELCDFLVTNENWTLTNLQLDVTFNIYGKELEATRGNPAEYPELEVESMIVKTLEYDVQVNDNGKLSITTEHILVTNKFSEKIVLWLLDNYEDFKNLIEAACWGFAYKDKKDNEEDYL